MCLLDDEGGCNQVELLLTCAEDITRETTEASDILYFRALFFTTFT